MSQTVKIECSTCEGICTHEFEGCVVIGFQEKEINMDHHDCSPLQLREFASYLVGYADGLEDAGREQK